MKTVDAYEKTLVAKNLPDFHIGDTVDVHYRIKEGDKERIQIFNGTVLRMKRNGSRTTFTVRRIVAGEGVERVFPLHSPKLDRIAIRRRGRVRRSRLYYLRDRVGKAVKVQEQQGIRPTKESKRKSRRLVVAGEEEEAPAAANSGSEG